MIKKPVQPVTLRDNKPDVQHLKNVPKKKKKKTVLEQEIMVLNIVQSLQFLLDKPPI